MRRFRMAKTQSKLWQMLRAGLLGRLVLLSVLVGIVAGFGAVFFNLLLTWTDNVFMVRWCGYTLPQPGAEGVVIVTEPLRRWGLLIVPVIGGLLSGLLVYTFAPETEGHGTDAVVDAFHRKRGIIRGHVPLVKTVASALTIGSGGSAGREGPIAQIGAGFGSALARWLKATDRERRLLMLAGAGAGLGAIFRAPLGGAFFVTEVLYRDVEFESSGLVPTFVASIVAYSIYCAVNRKWGAIFSVPSLNFNHPMELVLYLLLGMICAAAGIVYVKVFYGVRDRLFRKLPLPNHIKPALGGVVVGAMGFFLPQVLGMGYGWAQLAIDGSLPLKLALAIAGVKILATGFTIGSGGSGGVFAPSMVIGACLGSTMGLVFHHWMPGVATQPAAFALVGMAGFFAGVSKAPVATLIMVSEMAVGYGLLVPLMLTTGAAYLLTPRRISIYEKQVDARIDSPAHEGEYVVDVLEGIRVKDILPKDRPLTTFHPNSPLAEILEGVSGSKQQAFPVVDADGVLRGVIFFDDIRLFFTERGLPPRAVVAQDLLAPTFETAYLDENLASVLQKFRQTMHGELAAVDREGSGRVVGVVSRRDVLAMYHDRVAQRRKREWV